MESDLKRMIGVVLEDADRLLTAAEIARAVAEHPRWEMRGWPLPPSRVESHLADGFDGWVEDTGGRWCLRPQSLWPDATPFWRRPAAPDIEITPDAVRGVLSLGVRAAPGRRDRPRALPRRPRRDRRPGPRGAHRPLVRRHPRRRQPVATGGGHARCARALL